MNCPHCGNEVRDEKAVYCPHCSKPFREVLRRKTGLPIAAGIMTIFAACICAFIGGMNLILSMWGYLYINDVYYPINDIHKFVAGVSGVLAFIFGLVSGRMSLRRKHFGLSIAGMCFIIVSVLIAISETVASVRAHNGILSVGGILVFHAPPIVLAILSLILVAVSRKEFS